MYTDTGARPRDTYAKETPFGYRHFQNVHAGVSLEFRFESMKKSKKKSRFARGRHVAEFLH